MSLQSVFAFQSISGWFKWNDNKIKTSYLSNRWLFLLIFPIWIILYLGSKYFNGSDLVLDSLTSSLGILAVYLTSNKKVESWIIWSICDLFLVFLFIKNDLYLSSILYFVFLIISILGFFKWRRDIEIH